MKAYMVQTDWTEQCDIVFAETANKAKSAALGRGICEDVDYIDIHVKRLPEIDKFYKGVQYDEYFWRDLEVRKILIEKYGWYCLYPFHEECERCQLCEEYEQIKEEIEYVKSTKYERIEQDRSSN